MTAKRHVSTIKGHQEGCKASLQELYRTTHQPYRKTHVSRLEGYSYTASCIGSHPSKSSMFKRVSHKDWCHPSGKSLLSLVQIS